MTRNKLLAALRNHTGPVYVDACNHDDVFSIQAVKSDIIACLSDAFGPDAETGFDFVRGSGCGYLEKDWDAVRDC